MNDQFLKVQGKCTSCGRDSLFLGEGGFITCSSADCGQPGLTSDLINNPDYIFQCTVVAKSTALRGTRLMFDGGPRRRYTHQTVTAENVAGPGGMRIGVDEMTFCDTIGVIKAGERFLVTLQAVPDPTPEKVCGKCRVLQSEVADDDLCTVGNGYHQWMDSVDV